MTIPTGRRGAKLLPCLAIAVCTLACLLTAAPAAAQQLDRFHSIMNLFSDRDGSGGPSCGDHIHTRVTIGSSVGSFDLTNLSVRWPVPPNTRIVPGHTTLGFGPESDCTLLSGTLANDTEVAAFCSFLCRTGGDGTDGTCIQVGLDLQARLEILDPNLSDEVVLQASADADQIDPSVSDAIGTSAVDDPSVLPYEPCPPAEPPVLEATLVDTLLHDVNGDGMASAGDSLRYFVSITNIGGHPAVDTVFALPRPEHTTLEVGSVAGPPGGTVVSGNSPGDVVVEVAIGDVPAGETVAITFNVLIDSPLPLGVEELSAQGTVVAQGVSTVTDDPATPAPLDPTITELGFAPDLAVDKIADPASAEAGGIGLFRIAYSNLGSTTAFGVHLHEIVPAHTVFDAGRSSPGWSCPDGSGPGTVCTLVVGTVLPNSPSLREFALRVDSALPVGVTSTTNTVSITHDGTAGPDSDPRNDTSTAILVLTGEPLLALTKNGPATGRPGDQLAYTLTATNHGGREAPDAVLIEIVPSFSRFDAAGSSPGWSCPNGSPPGTTCTLELGTLSTGATSTATYAVRLDATMPHGAESLTNTAQLRDGAGSPPADASATTALTASPSFQLEKAGPASAAPGELVTFFLGFGNAGDQDAAGVEVTDTVPPHGHFVAAESTAGWSCQDGSPSGTPCTLPVGALAAGDGSMATFSIRLDPTVPAGLESITNTATVADGDGTPPVSDSATVAVDASPILSLTKTGPASARPGQTIVFTLTYANEGNQDAASVELHDTVPDHTTFDAAGFSPGWSCPDGAPAGTPCTLALGPLPISTTGSVTFAVRLADTVPGDLIAIRNTALLTGEPEDPPGEDEVEVPVDAAPDLRLSKDGPSSARPGELIAFALAYANVGDRDAPAASLLDTVPLHTTFASADSTAGWSCPDGAPAGTACSLDLGPLAAGAAGTATFTVRLDASVPAGITAVRNTALLTGEPDDPPGEDEVEVPVDAHATLVLDKRGPLSTAAGDEVTYTLEYAIRGDTTSPAATLTDTVPAHTTFVAAGSSPGWSCPDGAAAGTTCSLALGDLPPGTSGTASFVVRVLATATSAGEIVNTATLTDAGGHPPATDTVTTPVDTEPPTGASLVATLIDTFVEDADGDGLLGAGDYVGYTAVITNLGPAAATGVHFTIAPDPNTQLIPESVTTTSGIIDTGSGPGDDHVAVTLGDLAAGASAVVTFEVRLADPLPEGLKEISAQGHVLALNTAPTVTDDPDTPEPLDPTVTPLGEDGPPAIVEIPTLHGVGLAALAALLTAVAFRRLRPARRTAR